MFDPLGGLNMDEIKVNGTLIWYYHICKREVWLMSRKINPDQDNANIDLGRFIHENSYKRNKKEIAIGNIMVDVVDKSNGYLVLGEIKKSSKFEDSARMQLAYYLLELRRHGLDGKGRLVIPKEKKKIEIELTDELIKELEEIEKNIIDIIKLENPQKPEKIKYCTNCAYGEFCWA